MSCARFRGPRPDAGASHATSAKIFLFGFLSLHSRIDNLVLHFKLGCISSNLIKFAMRCREVSKLSIICHYAHLGVSYKNKISPLTESDR